MNKDVTPENFHIKTFIPKVCCKGQAIEHASGSRHWPGSMKPDMPSQGHSSAAVGISVLDHAARHGSQGSDGKPACPYLVLFSMKRRNE